MSGTARSPRVTFPWRWSGRYGRVFLSRNRSAKRLEVQRSGGGRWYLAAVVLVTLAGGALRVSHLDHPMRYDESMVYFDYVDWSAIHIATHYDCVQNHVLHTLLERASIRLFGDTPAALRLPALLAGTIMIPLAIVLGRSVTRNVTCGLLAGGLVAASSVLVDYSTNARGYTMVAAFTLGMCLCTMGLIRDPRRRRLWSVWALTAVLGAFTMPTMVFPVVGLAGLLACDAVFNRRPRRRRVQLVRLAVTLVVVGVGTLAVYAPALIRTGATALVAARGPVQLYTDIYFRSAADVVAWTWGDWSRDFAAPGLVLAGVGLLLGLGRSLRSRSFCWAFPWGLFVGGVAVALLLPVQPYPRLWLYLLPVVLIFSVSGLALIPLRGVRRLALAVMGVSVVIGGYRVSQREFLVAEDPHTLVDAELVAEACAEWPDREFGLVAFPMTNAIKYYAVRRNLPRPSHPIDPRVNTTYVVVNHTQKLADVLDAKGDGWRASYGPPRLVRNLPHSRLYQMDRVVGPGRVAER